MENHKDSNCYDCKVDLTHKSTYLTHVGSLVCENCAAPYLAFLNSTNAAQSSSVPSVLSDTVLQKLKCSMCAEYLSCGPVHLTEDGGATCGRCVPLDNLSKRNTQYEALAQLMLFPCRYKKYGCTELVPFFNETEVSHHEKICGFRKELCPLLVNQCEWKGPRAEILQHCHANHQNRVVENPCNLEYDISVDSVCTFLLIAFEDLFLFHTKVSNTTKQIHHEVQHIGVPDDNISEKFVFTVKIIREHKMVTQSGEITPYTKFDDESKTCLTTNMKQLEKALGGLHNCIFTITVNKIIKPLIKCVQCKQNIDQFLYKENGNWYCEACIPEKTTKCQNNCSFQDLEKKCQKHETFFCPRSTFCWLCRKLLRAGEFTSHYTSNHLDESCTEDLPWQTKRTEFYDKMLLLLTAKAGNALIKYKFNDSLFMIQIRTQIKSEHLYKYHCILKVSIPGDSQKTRIYVLNTLYNEMYDWKLELCCKDFHFEWPKSISVVVNIQQGSKPQLGGAKNVIYQ